MINTTSDYEEKAKICDAITPLVRNLIKCGDDAQRFNVESFTVPVNLINTFI